MGSNLAPTTNLRKDAASGDRPGKLISIEADAGISAVLRDWGPREASIHSISSNAGNTRVACLGWRIGSGIVMQPLLCEALDLELNAATGQAEVISQTRLDYPPDQWLLIYSNANINECIDAIPDARMPR